MTNYDADRPSDEQPIPDSIPTDKVVTQLLHAGMAPELIAVSMGLPVAHVRSITRVVSSVSLQEQQLQEDVRTLASMAVKQAARILQFGPTEQKLRVITSLLGHTARLIGTGDGTGSGEIRERLEELFVLNRGVPVRQTIVTDTHVVDVQATESGIRSAHVQSTPPPPEPVVPPDDGRPRMHAPNEGQSIGAQLKALLETVNDQDQITGTTEVRY